MSAIACSIERLRKIPHLFPSPRISIFARPPRPVAVGNWSLGNLPREAGIRVTGCQSAGCTHATGFRASSPVPGFNDLRQSSLSQVPQDFVLHFLPGIVHRTGRQLIAFRDPRKALPELSQAVYRLYDLDQSDLRRSEPQSESSGQSGAGADDPGSDQLMQHLGQEGTRDVLLGRNLTGLQCDAGSFSREAHQSLDCVSTGTRANQHLSPLTPTATPSVVTRLPAYRLDPAPQGPGPASLACPNGPLELNVSPTMTFGF